MRGGGGRSKGHKRAQHVDVLWPLSRVTRRSIQLCFTNARRSPSCSPHPPGLSAPLGDASRSTVQGPICPGESMKASPTQKGGGRETTFQGWMDPNAAPLPATRSNPGQQTDAENPQRSRVACPPGKGGMAECPPCHTVSLGGRDCHSHLTDEKNNVYTGCGHPVGQQKIWNSNPGLAAPRTCLPSSSLWCPRHGQSRDKQAGS